jgi:hypothetical protein
MFGVVRIGTESHNCHLFLTKKKEKIRYRLQSQLSPFVYRKTTELPNKNYTLQPGPWLTWYIPISNGKLHAWVSV